MRRKWTIKEETFLEKWYHKKDISYFAKRFKTTNDSVKRKAQNMGLNAYIGDKLYVRTVAKCFNCDSRVINRWITIYNLPHSIVIRGKLVCKLIDYKDFWIWAENHKDIISWNKYDRGSILPEPDWLKECIMKYSYKNNRKTITDYDILAVVSLKRKGYTFNEISKETGRTLDSVKHIWRNYNKNKQSKGD